MAEKPKSDKPAEKKPETEKKPKSSQIEKGESSETLKTERKKRVTDAGEKAKQKKNQLEEKRKAVEDKKTFLKETYAYEATSWNPPDTDSEDAGIEEHYLWDEKWASEKAETEMLDSLKEKHAAEVALVTENKSLDGLDKDTKKAVHTEIVRQSLDVEKIPNNFLEEAQKDVQGEKKGELSPEEKAKVKNLALKKQAQKMQEDYEKALTEDAQKTPPGTTAWEMLKWLEPWLQNALTLKALTENKDNLGGETTLEIAERVLAEKNLAQYVDVLGKDFDLKKVSPDIRKMILLSPDFEVPESIKGSVDGFKLAVMNNEFPFVERSDFPEGAEGDKAYQEATKKTIEENTWLSEKDLNKAAEKLQKDPTFQSADRSKMHPFLRFILDMLSWFGAAMEEAGFLKGDFWRKYIGSKNSQWGNVNYMNNGVSGPWFEVGKTTSGDELIGSAEKYLGRPYSMGWQGRLNVPWEPIDCSQLVVNSLRDVGCLPEWFDTTASWFAQRSELAGQKDGKPGDFLIRTEWGADHIAIITGWPDANGNYTTIESTSRNSAGSGVIKTTRQASPDGDGSWFKVYKNPFLAENKPEMNNESVPEGGEEKKVVPTHYWHDKSHDKEWVDKWTEKWQTKSWVSLFDKSGNPITPETHGYGFCAVDPNIIPLGSIVVANGKKYYAVDIWSHVTEARAAKERGLWGTPVIDFYSKHPVGPEWKGLSMNIRVLPPNKSDRSLADLKKGYTPGSIPEVDQNLAGNAKGVVSASLDACRRWDIMGALHCTDWVDKIYKKTTWSSVYNAPIRFNGVRSINRGTGIGVGSYASEGQIAGIVAGQHLIVDKPSNGNYGVGRTHSVITLWSPVNGLVKVVSYPNNKIPPKVETYDLYGKGRGNKDGKVLRIQW